MFVVTEGHLSGTKRVVFWSARNETKRGMQGHPQVAKQGKVTLGQARQAKDAKDTNAQANINGSQT